MPKVPVAAPEPRGSIEPTGEACAFEGGPGSGKTHALVDRVRALLDDGASQEQILVFAATPDAARIFEARLAQACPQAAGVRVTTPREWCLELLTAPEAQAQTGRDARLLAPFENDILMEDLMRLSIRPRRLYEMLKFFHKSMTELADDEADEWLLTEEEKVVFHTLKDCLGFVRGIIEPELSNLAVRFLQAKSASRAKAQVAHVIVDDYQMLSRASQVAANLIARDSIAIAYDPAGCLEVFESYPYAEGPSEFMEANPSATKVELATSYACEAGARATNLLRVDAVISAEPLEVQVGRGDAQVIDLAAPDPAGEMDAASTLIAQLIADGMAPDDIVVASPHPTWTANLVRALQAQGIAAEVPYDERIVSGGFRNSKKRDAARVLTALYLTANRFDAVAWRSWCGFNDESAYSAEVQSLRDSGAQSNRALDAMLESDGAVADAPHVIDAYNKGLALFQKAEVLEGQELLAFLASSVLGEGKAVPASILRLCSEMPDGSFGGKSAAALAARAQARLAAPTFEHAGRVLITTYRRTTGLSPKALLLCGFVNGFFPDYGYFAAINKAPEKADRQHEHDMRLMTQIAGKPIEVLAVSYFEQVPSGVAEKLGLKIRRIRLKDKKPIALIEPSEYLERLRT